MEIKCTVTKDDLKYGNDQPCNCPVVRALNRELEKINPRYYAEFAPYACFREPRGLEIFEKWAGDEPIAKIRKCPEELVEFAIIFDDWFRFKYEHGGSLKSYRETTGEEDRPDKPYPFEFVLNIELPGKGEGQ